MTLEGELIRKCLSRTENQCSFLDHRDYKVIYRRYASLYFIIGVDNNDDVVVDGANDDGKDGHAAGESDVGIGVGVGIGAARASTRTVTATHTHTTTSSLDDYCCELRGCCRW